MIFNMLQQHSFSHEISSLKSNAIIHRLSSFFRLDPLLDTDGVLTVGGRLKRSMLDINEVYPVILPKATLITEGASNELKKALNEMSQEQIRQHLLKSGTD